VETIIKPVRPAASLGRGLSTALAVAVVLAVIYFAGRVFLLLGAAVLVAVMLYSPAAFLARRTGLHRQLCLLLVGVGLVLVVALAVIGAAPSVAEQSRQLWEQLPQAWSRLISVLPRLGISDSMLAEIPKRLASLGSDAASQAVGGILGAASITLGSAVDTVIIVMLGLYFAIQPELYVGGLVRLFPPRRRARTQAILGEVGEALQGWLMGQLFAMLLIGLACGIGLWLLGIPLALVLGLFAGLITFIPTLGPWLALIPAVLVASGVGLWPTLYVIALYAGIQALETYIITPVVQRRTVDLPPALLLTTQLMAGVLAGILGLALAAPFAAAMLVVVRMAYIEDVLGDRAAHEEQTWT
jgi:predicted PurR-regulated permease PerM